MTVIKLTKLYDLLSDKVGKDDRIDYVNPLGWLYQNVCSHFPGPPEFGSLLYAILIVTLYWTIGYWMDKKKIYIRA